VAAGTEDTDAANVAQLKALEDKLGAGPDGASSTARSWAGAGGGGGAGGEKNDVARHLLATGFLTAG